MRRGVGTLLAAVLLLPGALGAGAHETHGRLVVEEGVSMRGQGEVWGEGLLEIEPSGADPGLRLDFGRLVEGRLVDRTRDVVHVGLAGQEEASASRPEWTSIDVAPAGAGRVENVRCGPSCIVVVHAVPDEGLLGLRGSFAKAPDPTAQPREISTSTARQGAAGSQFRYVLPAGTLEISSSDLADPRPWASGRVGLVLADATFDLVTDDGRRAVDARSTDETTREAAGRPITVRHHTRHVELVLDDPTIDVAPGAPLRFSFPGEVHARFEGALASSDASGSLVVAGKRHALDHDRVLLEGTMDVLWRAAEAGILGGARGLDAELEGRMERVVVGSADITPAFSPQTAQAGGGVVALTAMALLGRLALAPLYHRLGPSNVLSNANRRRIYEAVRARPGVGVGELVAAVGLSRILVRHHLRMLEAHKAIRATAWRRRLAYTVVGERGGKAACELKDATRLRIAAALARAGGATQKDLSGALGLSQRLVSYHLSRLEASALVRTQGHNPRSYVATEELASIVAKGSV